MVVDDRVSRYNGIHFVNCRLNVNRFLTRRRGVHFGSHMLPRDSRVLWHWLS